MKNTQTRQINVTTLQSYLILSAMLVLTVMPVVRAFAVTCNSEGRYLPAPRSYEDTSDCPGGCTVKFIEPHDTRCGTAVVPYAYCDMTGPYGATGTQYDGVGKVYNGRCDWDSYYGWSCVDLESEPSSITQNEAYVYPYMFGYDAELCPE